MLNQIIERRRWKRLSIGLIFVLLVSLAALSSCAPSKPAETPTPQPAPTPTPEETPTPLPEEKPTPEPAPAPAPYTETQFSLTPGEVYRVSIFAETNNIIECSWKADDHIDFWYTTPNGVAFLPRSERMIWPPPNEQGRQDTTYLRVGDTFSIKLEGADRKTGYYTFCFIPGQSATKPVPVVFRYRVGKPVQGSQSATPPTQEPQPASTPTITKPIISSSDITSEPLAYNGKEVELSGQTYLEGSGPRLLVDGKSGISITGNTATLQKGFYRLTGVYDADTNTLDVTESSKEEVEYLAIEASKELGIDLIPVSVEGLVATVPKDIADSLTAYISVPYFPEDMPIYPYVVYGKAGFYLALSDTLVHLPAEFTCLYQGKDYSFTFSAAEVKGTLVKTPAEEIDFGPEWQPDEFGGVVIASSITARDPMETTVGEINANPDNFVFKRVSVSGSYIVTTARIDYSEIKAPMGQGILTDRFTDFFAEDQKKRLETIDPERKVWQLRECQVIGTILYPTEEILKYLDYSAPLTKSEIQERLKPALIVDSLVDQEIKVASISELNPLVGEPSQYWGKVVEFEGYALGINYPLKKLVQAVTGQDIPVNVNVLAVGIADDPAVGSQLAIIGLNNDLIDEQGEVIKGKFKFRVAVTHMPEELVSGVPYADTALFLLTKEELPIEIPTLELYSLNTSISPPGSGLVAPSSIFRLAPGVLVTLTAMPAPGYTFDHWSGDASGTSATITITMDSNKSATAHFKRIL